MKFLCILSRPLVGANTVKYTVKYREGIRFTEIQLLCLFCYESAILLHRTISSMVVHFNIRNPTFLVLHYFCNF